MNIRTILALSVLSVGLGGCSGSDSSESDGQGAVVGTSGCKLEELKLKGGLETQPIDLSFELGSFGYGYGGAGWVLAQFGSQGELKLATPTKLELGEPVAANGKLKLPSEAPSHAGETLCVGDGSTATVATEEGLVVAVKFQLQTLASGSDCSTPLAGSFEACFAHEFEED